MGLAAVALISTTAVLAVKAFSAAPATPAATGASSGLLATPAPAFAATLPRRYETPANQSILLAVAQFRQRFAVLVGGSPAPYPAALYGEPGRVNPVTGATGWVMYLGYNSRAGLGPPTVTTARLMAGLMGGATRPHPWAAAAGPLGGSALCSGAVIGLTPMSVCVWATGQTAGALMAPAAVTTGSELAALMLAMRPSLQGP
jgi:hypothetical protein